MFINVHLVEACLGVTADLNLESNTFVHRAGVIDMPFMQQTKSLI